MPTYYLSCNVITTHHFNYKKNNRNSKPFQSFHSFAAVETKERISRKTEELFFKFGIRSVTMDDIAKALGISKKTIYIHFKDKDEIVEAVAEQTLQRDKYESEKIHDRAKDPIDEIIQSTQLMREMVANIHPALLFDLQKYHPKAWKRYIGHKEGFVKIVLRNITEGQHQGLYRPDIEPEILARFRVESIDSAFNTEVFPSKKFALIDVQLQLIDHFLRGILTPKGFKLYEKYKQEQ